MTQSAALTVARTGRKAAPMLNLAITRTWPQCLRYVDDHFLDVHLLMSYSTTSTTTPNSPAPQCLGMCLSSTDVWEHNEHFKCRLHSSSRDNPVFNQLCPEAKRVPHLCSSVPKSCRSGCEEESIRPVSSRVLLYCTASVSFF